MTLFNPIRRLRSNLASISTAVRASGEYTRSAARFQDQAACADKAIAGIPI